MLWPHLPLAPLVVAVLCGAAICAVLSRHRSSWAPAANASAVFADFVVVYSCVCSIFDLFIVRHLCLVLPPDAGSRARFSSSARTGQGGSVMPLFCGPSLPLNLLIPEVLGPGERDNTDGPKSQPPTRCGGRTAEPRPKDWGGERRELARTTTKSTPCSAHVLAVVRFCTGR